MLRISIVKIRRRNESARARNRRERLRIVTRLLYSPRIVYIAIAACYVPVFYDLATRYWIGGGQPHNFIVAAAIGGLAIVLAHRPTVCRYQPRILAGALFVAIGLCLLTFGKLLAALSAEVFSLIPLILGSMLLLCGWDAVRAGWLPVLLSAFLIPLPEVIAEAFTGPLKILISQWAADFLYLMGYPVARSGAVLFMGNYQLLVADACSGMRSILSLYALALIYLFFRRDRSTITAIVLLAAVLPIAVSANFLRVVVLLLLVFYRGERAIEGTLHLSTGFLLMLLSIILFLFVDSLVSRISIRAASWYRNFCVEGPI